MPPRPALIFDLAETIIGGLIGIERRLSSVRLTTEQIAQVVAGGGLWSLCRGEISELEYYHYLQESGVVGELSFAAFQSVVRSMFDREVDGMPAYVLSLAERCDLFLLSDHSREWSEYILRRHPFLSCFRHCYFSFELRKLKRDGVPFEKVCASIGVPRDRIAFIDDSEANIRAAAEFGLKTFLFKSRSDLEPRLEAWLTAGGPNHQPAPAQRPCSVANRT